LERAMISGVQKSDAGAIFEFLKVAKDVGEG
jgi:hypothetical protein